ncbi:hypothetical protein BJF78_23045 [Pseudonocardia sp. CNS-139]|nr:hypothetical protein BJF78_23045 [Pseudonocardia sp. CNS-139]
MLGGKAHGLVGLIRLGLPVPPGFVIGTAACRAFLRDARFPDGLDAELAVAVAGLEAATGRRLGGPERPLVLAVRSGAPVPMPGMMSTVLDVGLTAAATAGLAAETGDPAFAADTRRRFLAGAPRPRPAPSPATRRPSSGTPCGRCSPRGTPRAPGPTARCTACRTTSARP